MKLTTTGEITGVNTEAKKTSGSALRTPSAAPALVKERMRPLTKTMNWVGPAVPMESGGKAPVSVSVAPSKVVTARCWRGATADSAARPGSGAGYLETGKAPGLCGRWLRSG